MPNDNVPKTAEESWLSSRAKHWLKHFMFLIPVLSLGAAIVLWVDARYMHKQAFSIYDEIADFRYNDLQIRVLEAQVINFKTIINSGGTLSVKEQIQYETDLDQLKNLKKQRNEIMGLLGDIE